MLELKRRGHTVTILTGKPNYPDGDYFPGYGFFRTSREDYHGIPVIRVPLITRGKSKGLRLALNYLSFVFFASLFGPLYCRGRYDAIFVFEPSPITVCLPAIVLKKIFGAPIFFWVLDLWPESLSATGAVSSPFVLGLVRGLVRFIYSQCDRILVSSKGFIEFIAPFGVKAENIRYFPNWAEEIYWRRPEGEAPAAFKAVPPGFRLVFAGNIGAAQNFETLLGAAELLKGNTTIQWVILGDGRMADWVKEEIAKRGLAGTFHMLGRHTPEDVARVFFDADALLVSLRPDPVFALTVPGKVQSYLACGKPVVASLEGEGARLIKEAGAGLAAPAGDPAALAKAVLALKEMPQQERGQMGARGLAYCRENFLMETLVARLETWLTEVPKKYN